MKSIKLFAVVAVLMVVFVGGMGMVSYNLIMDVLQPQEATEAVTVERSNVGNGETYEYVITSVEGNEINGDAITKKSSDNAGIFLYKNEVMFPVHVGDKIAVVWGEYEDEFKSIEKIK